MITPRGRSFPFQTSMSEQIKLKPYEGLAPEVVWEFEVSPWRYVSNIAHQQSRQVRPVDRA